MKAIMISIRPEWVEKIIKGEKTIEIRKTMPKCELPCKVYIYCTKGKDLWMRNNDPIVLGYKRINGKVVAEFVLNKITKHEKNYIDVEDNLCYNFLGEDVKNAGFVNIRMDDWEKLNGLLDFNNFVNVYGDGKPLYAWHIDDLKIYDKPKKFSSFIVGKVALDCGYGNYNIYNKVLKRPPQAWCYVEKLK